jgi:hypothetical protein
VRRRNVAASVLFIAALPACGAVFGLSDSTNDVPPSGDRDAAAATDGDAGSILDATSEVTVDAADAEKDAPLLGCQGAVNCDRVVFVTSTTGSGNLGGIEGADAKCNATASSSSHPSVKGKTFKAWIGKLTNGKVSPKDRLTQGTGNYVLPFGDVIAKGWAPFASAVHEHAIDRNEAGQPTTVKVWTGATADGEASGDDCDGWTTPSAAIEGVYGTSVETGAAWSASGNSACNDSFALYCVED